MYAVVEDLRDGLLDLIFPPHCLLCRKYLPPDAPQDASQHVPQHPRENQICPSCQTLVQPNRPPFCTHCSRPLEHPTSSLCRICLKEAQNFDYTWSACIYNDTMKRLIHLFKYGGKTSLRHYFCRQMIGFIETYHIPIHGFDWIIPIPLHGTRFKERGYNQAQLLAEILAREFHIPISTNNLRRSHPTRNQAVLSKKERWTNIQGAFKIKHSEPLKQQNILLVDDLYTTGATVNEAACCLKEAGANSVGVLTVAIAALEY